jgi:hypothetical protein
LQVIRRPRIVCPAFARVAELADAYGSGPYGETRGGSSPLASSKANLRAVYLDPAFLLAAHRAFISSESFLRPAGVRVPFFLALAVFVPPAFLRAAQRAFINWESFLRPAGVSWPFFLAGVAARAPLSLAQRAFAAAASFARVVAEK